MTTIFYLIGLWFMLSEVRWITSPIKKSIESRRFKELLKEEKGKKWEQNSIELKDMIKTKIIFHLIPLIWVMIGIFSKQWILFLFIFVYSLISSTVSSWVIKYWLYTFLNWISSVIEFLVALFIILNHYHLHIDLFKLLKSYF